MLFLVRQEKLLQGLMSDILHMTSQTQPLNVGVPLYPFSRTSLFDPTFQPTIQEVVDASHNAESHISSSLAGRTGEILRGASVSVHVSPPKSPPLDMHGAASGSMGDEYAMGRGSTQDYGGDMISSQGLWKAAEYDPMQLHGNGTVHTNTGHSSGSSHIFQELGL